MYRWIATAAVGASVVGFGVGAALMGQYAQTHAAAPPATPRSGLAAGVPVLGDMTKTIGQPVGSSLCTGAHMGGYTRGVPVLEQISTAAGRTVDVVNGVTGGGRCDDM